MHLGEIEHKPYNPSAIPKLFTEVTDPLVDSIEAKLAKLGSQLFGNNLPIIKLDPKQEAEKTKRQDAEVSTTSK
jgi:hypothetical protein